MIPTVLVLAVNAASNAALRAVASAGLTPMTVASVLASAGNRTLVRWAPASLAADSPPTVWKPDDVAPANPGRWVIVDWVELAGEAFHGEILIGVTLGNAAPPAANFVFQVGDDWQLCSVTQDGASRIAWFKKRVEVPS